MQQESEGLHALNQLNQFCQRVIQGMDEMTFDERQQLLRLVVERITVEDGRVNIETVIPVDNRKDQLCARRGELVEP